MSATLRAARGRPETARLGAIACCALAAGCEPPAPPRYPLGVSEVELAQPGITCPHGLAFTDDHGCTGETEGGTATLRVVQQNDMSSGFVFFAARYTLDGRLLYNWNGREGEQTKARAVVFEAKVGPGEHVIDAILRYRGHGEGVFSYLKGYKFQVRSSHTFRVEAYRGSEVVANGYEKGGVTTPLEERPAVRWTVAPRRPHDEAVSAPPLAVPSGSP